MRDECSCAVRGLSETSDWVSDVRSSAAIYFTISSKLTKWNSAGGVMRCPVPPGNQNGRSCELCELEQSVELLDLGLRALLRVSLLTIPSVLATSKWHEGQQQILASSGTSQFLSDLCQHTTYLRLGMSNADWLGWPATKLV